MNKLTIPKDLVRIGWCTDIHLDVLERYEIRDFARSIAKKEYDLVLLTGDISTFDNLKQDLAEMDPFMNCPVFFTLGNHDYYGTSLDFAGEEVKNWEFKNMLHLPSQGPIELVGFNTHLVGVDNLYDGGSGNPRAEMSLMDFAVIWDFVAKSWKDRKQTMKDFAYESNMHMWREALAVMQPETNVNHHTIIACHVPPFAAASLHRGKQASDDSLPFFSNQMLGNEILRMADHWKGSRYTSISGHTHAKAVYQTKHPNVLCRVGGARYGTPEIQPELQLHRDGTLVSFDEK